MKSYAGLRLVAGGLALVAGLVASMLSPHGAHAQIILCRDDPVVSLLNLGQLDLQSSIADSASDVKQITYTVHVPKGTTVLAVTNLDGLFGLRSVVKVYADDVTNTFDVYTTVTTGKSKIAVTANSTLVSALILTLGLSAVSGVSGQTLHSHFTPLL